MKTVCSSSKLKLHRNQFWQAVWIWYQKPHIVNRRLFGVKTLYSFSCLEVSDNSTIFEKLQNLSINEIDLVNFQAKFITLMSPLRLELCQENEICQISEKTYIIMRKLLTKNCKSQNFFEVCVISYPSNSIVHYQISPPMVKNGPSISFILEYENETINVKLFDFVDCKWEWLKYLLLPKLLKWSEESSLSSIYEYRNTSSLRLVPSDEYHELYLKLKEKYGKEIVEKWPENTDPSKFVYEDIAIASYLCILWNHEKVKFVDLGCGNGLLVHILNCEGYNGFGIDIRSRKIWSLYSPQRDLRTGTITPDCNSYFPDVDWIIGNHSDELTPWIPVFALRNSYKCKFFLLPCCAYEFSGKKYQRQNSSVSVYNDFIDYTVSICTELGFICKTDKLRIPSTKRICIIGDTHSYGEEKYEYIKDSKISAVLQKRNSEYEFKPRDKVEKVRNCTQIDKLVTSKIINVISTTLIANQIEISKKKICDIWSTEYSITFKNAINLLEPDDLKKLKNECGGLQTLLRNHHSLFLIQEGRIYFRKPTEVLKKHDKWKNRQCWFFHNHPCGCPVDDNKCCFMH